MAIGYEPEVGDGHETVAQLDAQAPDVDTHVSTDRVSYPPPRWDVRAALVPTAVFFASRLLVLFAALAATWMQPTLKVKAALTGWDSTYYLTIARSGYPATTAPEFGGAGNRWAFFPGFPAAIRLVERLSPLNYVDSALLINLVAGLVATVAIWRWTELTFDRRTANMCAAVFCCFPLSYTLSMAYSEATLIALAACCVLAVRSQRWLLAAVLTALACTVRLSGLVLVGVLLVAALRHHRSMTWRSWLCLLPSLTGFAAWSAFQQSQVDSWTAFRQAEEVWGYGFRWFSTPFRSAWHVLTERAAWHSAPDVLATLALGFVVAGVVALATLAATRRVPAEIWVFTLGSIVVAFSSFWPSSVLRYVLPIFPIMAAGAYRIPGRYRSALITVLAGLQGILATVAFTSIITWQTAPFAP